MFNLSKSLLVCTALIIETVGKRRSCGYEERRRRNDSRGAAKQRSSKYQDHCHASGHATPQTTHMGRFNTHASVWSVNLIGYKAYFTVMFIGLPEPLNPRGFKQLGGGLANIQELSNSDPNPTIWFLNLNASELFTNYECYPVLEISISKLNTVPIIM
ncbi:hypothetical protein CBL_13898 [Carabus blaptoides fortunei]